MGRGNRILHCVSDLTIVILAINLSLGFATPPLTGLGQEHLSHHRQDILVEARPEYRLPRTIIPSRYECELRIILDEDPNVGERFTAPGNVKIDVDVDEKSSPKTITMHSVGINITTIKVTEKTSGLEQKRTGDPEFDIEKQFLKINLENPLQPKGKYVIDITFVAPIEPGSEVQFGLYRTSYQKPDGSTRYMAVTDFESVDARRMVPCFDEPDLKAFWKMTVIRQTEYHSLSNMKLESTQPDVHPNWEKDIYPVTAKVMPTYLLALTVSDYKPEPSSGFRAGVDVNVWGPPPLMDAPNNGGKYAAEFSAKVMKYFEDYLGVQYSFPKMDEFAIPEFSAGAMENWGLNTYRTVRLIWVEGSSTIQEKVQMTNTISHELAHQWFGNLVTMKWWDDLWLNEGFATHFANLAVSKVSGSLNPVYPGYELDDFVVVDSVQYAMQADVRGTTHPMHYANLSSPAETRYGFDTISYDKGASILRMIDAFLTENIFKAALTSYLNTYGGMNAEQEHLFTAIHSTTGVNARIPAGVDVNTILRTWTTQAGFPLIRVKRSTSTPTEIIINQEPFVNDTRTVSPNADKWYVPITFDTPSKPYNPADASSWLLPTDTNKVLASVPVADYIILNPEQTGYYRVMYEQSNLDKILQQLEASTLPFDPKTRSALLDDNLNLAFNGYQPIKTGLDFTKFLKKEDNLVPWATFVANMARPYRLLSRTGAYYNFKRYIRSTMLPTLTKINVAPQPNDKDAVANTYLLRNRLVEWSCNLGLQECIDYAKRQATLWINTPTSLPPDLTHQPDLRPFVYCAAVANADDKDQVFEFFLQQYNLPNTRDTDRISLVKALACSNEPHRLLQLLNLAINEKNPTLAAHRTTTLQAVAGNTIGLDIMLTFIQENFDTIINNQGGATTISSIITTASDYISSQSEFDTIQRFLDNNANKLTTVKASLDASRIKIETNVAWIKRVLDDMKKWLSANSS